jgi:hypothetical protein
VLHTKVALRWRTRLGLTRASEDEAREDRHLEDRRDRAATMVWLVDSSGKMTWCCIRKKCSIGDKNGSHPCRRG